MHFEKYTKHNSVNMRFLETLRVNVTLFSLFTLVNIWVIVGLLVNVQVTVSLLVNNMPKKDSVQKFQYFLAASKSDEGPVIRMDELWGPMGRAVKSMVICFRPKEGISRPSILLI